MRELAKDEKCCKEAESDDAGCEMKIQRKWSDRRSSGQRDWPEECSKGEFIDVSEDGGHDEKDKAVPEDVTLEKKPTYVKGTLGDTSQHRKHE